MFIKPARSSARDEWNRFGQRNRQASEWSKNFYRGQITGEFDQNAFEFGKTGVYNFDFNQEYELKLSDGRTISKLIAEKEGYQTFTIKYPPEQLTVYLSAD